MKKAGKFGVSYVVMLGEDELRKETAILRNMQESSQQEIAMNQLVDTLVNAVKGEFDVP